MIQTKTLPNGFHLITNRENYDAIFVNEDDHIRLEVYNPFLVDFLFNKCGFPNSYKDSHHQDDNNIISQHWLMFNYGLDIDTIIKVFNIRTENNFTFGKVNC